MFTAILIIHIIVSLILIFIVLLQSGRGAELGAAFGGAGQVNSVQSAATFISKFTTGLAVTFMLTSLTLAYLSSQNSRESVTESIRDIPQAIETSTISGETESSSTEESSTTEEPSITEESSTTE